MRASSGRVDCRYADEAPGSSAPEPPTVEAGACEVSDNTGSDTDVGSNSGARTRK